MTHNLKTVRRLAGAVAGASLVGALSMGTAGAALLGGQGGATLDASGSVVKCVTVAVPTATATVNASLKVSAAGKNYQEQASKTVSTGTLKVCVQADAGADVTLGANAVAGVSGTTVNVAATAVAGAEAAPVKAKVLVNDEVVLSASYS